MFVSGFNQKESPATSNCNLIVKIKNQNLKIKKNHQHPATAPSFLNSKIKTKKPKRTTSNL
jgi:hypothetical protein